MDTLTDMKLDKKKQISYRSTDEIVSKLDLAAARIAAANTTFGGNKLRTGHLVNAIALWVGEMPDDELFRFAKPKLEALESYLGRAEDEEAEADDSVDAVERDLIPTRPPRGSESKPDREHRKTVGGKKGAPNPRK